MCIDASAVDGCTRKVVSINQYLDGMNVKKTGYQGRNKP